MNPFGNLTQTTLIYPSIADISQNQYTNVLLIENTVPSYQLFVDSANANTFPIVYSRNCRGNELMELLQSHFTTIDRIGLCFVSRENNPVTFLDNTQLFTSNTTGEEALSNSNVRFMIDLINQFSITHVDFLACDTLTYPGWRTYYDILQNNTNAVVGASDNKTGNLKYGGDWILESTTEDIEPIYFNQTIQYYTYLLDNSSFITNTVSGAVSDYVGITTDGTYLYISGSPAASYASGFISRINIAFPAVNNASVIWANPTTSAVFNSPSGLAINDGNLYVASAGQDTISRISLSNPTTSYTTNWASFANQGIKSQRQIAIYDNYLYSVYRTTVATEAKIVKISLSTPLTDFSSTWATSAQGVNDPTGMVAYNGYLYVSSGTTGNISKISISNPTTDFIANWATTYKGNCGLYAKDQYLYSSEYTTGKISRIYINNPKDISSNWATSAARACGITNVGDNLYVANATKVAQLSTRPPLEFSTLTTSPAYATTLTARIREYNGNLYICGDHANIIRINLRDNSLDTNWVSTSNEAASPFGQPYSLSFWDDNLYTSDRTGGIGAAVDNYRKTYKININNKTRTVFKDNSGRDTNQFILSSAIVSGNLYIGSTYDPHNTRGFISRISLTNPSNSEQYWIADQSGAIQEIIPYNGKLYFSVATKGIYVADISSPSTYTLFSNSIVSPVGAAYSTFGLDICNNYLYTTQQSSNTIGRINLSNPADYTVEYAKNPSTAVSNSLCGIAIYGNTIYGVSYSGDKIITVALPVDPVYTIPFVPTITSTQSNSSGKLTITLSDPSNTAVNQTSYLYSTNDIVYKETGVFHNGSSTYNFTISETESGGLFTDISYTLYIKSVNGITQRSNSTSLPVIIYTTPTAISNCSASFISSGNINVSITETSPPPYYYVNNVSYLYYLYTPGTTNRSGNGLAYTFGANLHASSYTTNFVIQNQPANNYTVYLIAKNSFGNTATNAFSANVAVFTPPINSMTFDTGNTKTVAAGNLQVRLIDLSNTALNNVYYQYALNYTVNGYTINGVINGDISLIRGYTYSLQITAVNHPFWIQTVEGGYSSNNIYGNVTNNGIQNGTITFVVPNDAPNTLYYACQYHSSMQGRIIITDSVVPPSNIIIQNSGGGAYTINGVNNGDISLIRGYTYNLQITAGGHPFWIQTVEGGYSSNNKYDVSNNGTQNGTIIFVVPNNAPNTLYYACEYHSSMQGRIIITDSVVPPSTITILSGSETSFANTFVKANVSPYTFFIPSIRDISNTIYVRASNPVGNTSPSANLPIIVYQTPRTPSQVTFELVQSGNVRVTIQETAPIPDYYYLNNVSYFLYAYNTVVGTNLSGNTAASIYNVPVGILPNTNSSYGNVVSYVNTGLSANTYTMYVIAKNSFGNSNPVYANIVVYTTPDFPPKIDTTNTISSTSGNLTVSFTDPSNNPKNAISYWYYVYDPSTGANNAGNVLMYSNTGATLTTGAQQSFSLSGFVNKTYTVYLLSKNPVGNSTSTNANVTVYTVPTDVSIDTANTYSVSSGNLQVVLIDSSNGTNNGVYYQYSVIGVNGNAFSNASAQSIGTSSNQYRFYISGFSNATYTINVVAKNTVGTSNATTFIKTVYTTPTAPVIDPGNTLSKTSGNLTVTFNDTTNTVLNDISYGYFLYDSSIELYYG